MFRKQLSQARAEREQSAKLAETLRAELQAAHERADRVLERLRTLASNTSVSATRIIKIRIGQ
jgi:F0F1-type ATP synthase membrane subunit b/b'